MSNIITQFSGLLDFPLDTNIVSNSFIVNEAKHKYANTYMLVNDTVCFINTISREELMISTEKKTEIFVEKEKIKYIKEILPEPGLYYLKNSKNLVKINKLPHRHCKKSFSYDYYTISPINENTYEDDFSIYNIDLDHRMDIAVGQDNKIYYHSTDIGEIKDGNIFCTVPIFKQELIDWVKYGRYQ